MIGGPRWADVRRAVTLDPTVPGEGESIELFTEVLNHIVPLRFTVDSDINIEIEVDIY